LSLELDICGWAIACGTIGSTTLARIGFDTILGIEF